MSGNWYDTPHATRITLVDTDDTGPQQFSHASGLLGQDISKMTRLQHFGESSNPPVGSEGYALVLGGGSSRMVALGFEHPDHRPTNTPIGGKILYDAGGNAISLIMTELRIVAAGPMNITAAGTLTITAPTIALVGNVHLGSAGGVPASMQGTVDSGGNHDVSSLATKVFLT